MFCFCFNAIPKPAPRRRLQQTHGQPPVLGQAPGRNEPRNRFPPPEAARAASKRRRDGPCEGRAGLPALLPADGGSPFLCLLSLRPLPRTRLHPRPPGSRRPPQGCGARPPAALPAGSLRSLLQIRPHQSRRFSPRCLCGKEFSLGASHTHPGGCARSSGERSCGVATCHLWAERGNCSHVCLGVRMTPNQPLDRYACRALSASQNVLPQ